MADGSGIPESGLEPVAGDLGTERPPAPVVATAVDLCRRLADASGDALVLAGDEARAARLAAALAVLLPAAEVRHFPRWDVPPGEGVPPSRAAMGRRMAVLAALAGPAAGLRVVVATADAALQGGPSPAVAAAAVTTLEVGAPVDRDALERLLLRTGWILDERVDEPGEAALRGGVIDLFPPDAPLPVRIEHADGRIRAFHRFDPLTQRTLDDPVGPHLAIGAASEAVTPDDAADAPRDPGAEMRLAALYGTLESLLDVLAGAPLFAEPGALRRAMALLAAAAEEPRLAARLAPAAVALAAVGRAEPVPAGAVDPLPRYAARRDGAKTCRARVAEARSAGARVVVAAADPRDAAAVARRLAIEPVAADGHAGVRAAAPGAVLSLALDLEAGAALPDDGLLVVAAADVLGHRTRRAGGTARARAEADLFDTAAAVGDAVVHVDHGLGALEGLEDGPDGTGETVRLRYRGGATLLVPVAEMDRIWRYGSDPDAVTLDALGSGAWAKRRAKVEAALAEAAERLAAAAAERAGRRCPPIRPPADRFERFAAGFGYAETPDQERAIADVLADLASGRPMDRLVCGDVGYGKTEVALRAAAAVALAGRQVAIVAPTTVLARQHLETVRARFRGLGVAVGPLSRFATAEEARATRAGLRDGSIRIVVGTHAVAGRGVEIADLGLLVVDEEQRFGTAAKAALRRLGRDAHVLSLTATPIPRTLQGALAGLVDLSLVATAPAMRRPIVTRVAPWSDDAAADALRAEARRGGQSLVVCPRIEDLEPMAARLGRLAPELAVATLHARQDARLIDRTLLAFGRGEGDVLLATSIVESGLDMPRVNTLLVWHADRFGLADLHQLRGRVGRGSRRGVALLTTDPDAAPPAAAARRLDTLARLDRLGAGFALSAADLDQRGAGDLFGDDQAGHVRLIGAGLYRVLLERALRRARGDAVDARPPPEIRGVDPGRIPADWVPEPDVRLGLYARAFALADAAAVDAFADELLDRFGPPPPPADAVLDAFLDGLRLRALARAAGVVRLDLGPEALAFDFPDPAAAAAALADLDDPAASVRDTRLLLSIALPDDPTRRTATRHHLEDLT